jgi:hypothetical protein
MRENGRRTTGQREEKDKEQRIASKKINPKQ